MKFKKRSIIALIVLVTSIFGYWEYVHISCTQVARNYVNENKFGAETLDMVRMYGLSYKICSGKRGF